MSVAPRTPPSSPLLELRGLRTEYPPGRRGGSPVVAVDGVDLTVAEGTTLALVGESGCGKSTLARSVLRLTEPREGSIHFDGRDVRAMDRTALRAFRREAQIVFQDPTGSLNPRLSVGAALEEALGVQGYGRADRWRRAGILLEEVGLGDELRNRYPHELSGGQRQRVGIARALSVEPRFLVLDEPVSALDVSVQARVMALLDRLQRDRGLTYLLIAHDLALVRAVADRVVVMYRGRIMETASTERLHDTPRHPYTRVLLEAASGRWVGGTQSDPSTVREVGGADGAAWEGCPYYARCPHPARDAECRGSRPPLEGPDPGHRAACYKPPSGAPSGG